MQALSAVGASAGTSAGGTVGFLLSLLTESFAVRALVGSLAAAALAAVAVRLGLVVSRRARRLLILAPVLTAAAAGVASLRDAFLPQLWMASFGEQAGTQLLDLPGQLALVSLHREVDLLALAYAAVASVLLCRRMAGELVVRRTLREAAAHPVPEVVCATVARAAERMGLSDPRAARRLARTRARALPDCPGGAFTVGLHRPVVVVDPDLVARLDERELEGLLAHELAHVARGDSALGFVVGVFRDLTFFLPPVHVARRWLQREQEESADELAAVCTGRPAALASGILKVWDRTRLRDALPGAACAAVSSPRLALAGVGVGRSSAAQAITNRVERLISSRPDVSRGRLLAELVLAITVLSAATSAGILVPSWIASSPDRDALAFAYLAGVAEAPVESPAIRTFRALASAGPQAASATGEQRTGSAAAAAEPRTGAVGMAGGLPDDEPVGSCPCVETQGQLHRGVGAAGSEQEARMLWRRDGHDAWMVESGDGPGVAPARPLWTASDGDARFGFFLVGSPT